MKILKTERGLGFIHIQTETLDDLWTLHNLVVPGDLVSMDTYRTAESTGDRVREGKQEKKRMRLGLRVERVEWHDFDDHLRVHGVIEEGPQDLGKHHTHIVRDDREQVRIQKPGPLTKWQLDMLEEAKEASKAPQVILVAIDDSEAQFAVLRGYGLQWLGSLPSSGQGKRFDGAPAAKKAFYDEAMATLRTLRTSPDVAVIVVGPGWWREEFVAHVQDKDATLGQGLLTDGVAHGGRRGVQEAMSRGFIDKVARDHRVAWEMEQVERVMKEIATDGLVAYGPAEVLQAITVGAAEELLITDKALRDPKFAEIVGQAETTRCKVHVVASGHEAGARLDHLSGAAALLRFSLS